MESFHEDGAESSEQNDPIESSLNKELKTHVHRGELLGEGTFGKVY
jgi:hypothetical protein